MVEAKPSLIAKVREADLAVCTGAEPEVGWLPQLIRQSGNTRIASGPGSFEAAMQVKRLEVPSSVDRANGDVHPDGNPHVQMDPRRIFVIAKALDARLVQARSGERGDLPGAPRRLRQNAGSRRWRSGRPRPRR